MPHPVPPPFPLYVDGIPCLATSGFPLFFFLSFVLLNYVFGHGVNCDLASLCHFSPNASLSIL